MIPTVVQQLAAVRHTLAKTVLPALDPSARFAAEQAGLALASLDWTIDVVESEHRYERVEHADYRELLAALVALGGEGGHSDAFSLLDAAASPPDDLGGLREQTRALKRAVESRFAGLTADGTDRATTDEVVRLVAGVARRQTEREKAWTRRTGFPGDVDAVAEVLGAQSAVPAVSPDTAVP